MKHNHGTPDTLLDVVVLMTTDVHIMTFEWIKCRTDIPSGYCHEYLINLTHFSDYYYSAGRIEVIGELCVIY